MSTSKSLVASTVSAAPSTPALVPAPTPSERAAIVAFCREYRLHAAVPAKNRTPAKIASRVAQAVNETFGHKCNGGTFYTGADIMTLCVKEGVVLPS